ncbi:MAG TPA: methylmalonyl-CoA mutase family protein, partial [Planctomycetota bacterium]|nr:methylmalonyl-CoA mutase family protein [Planctomycetota bacterium]
MSKPVGDVDKVRKASDGDSKGRSPGRSRFPLTVVPDAKFVYDPSDLENWDSTRDLGEPGSYPFTRGPYENMYRGRLWTMRMFSGFGTARDTNARFKYLLEHGQTGLSIAFDMPTLMGYDSDHARSRGEVGREGVAVCSLQDMETLFAGIPMADVSTSMTINPTACILLAFYVACAERQGVAATKLRGTIQNDMLKEYIAQKEWVYPPLPSMRIITDMMAFCADHVPKWNTISISGYHIREAGSTALQELAYTLMDGFTYVEFGMKAGIPVDAFAPRLSFFFNSHMNFFEEIAKFRAARRIWARHMKERYGAKNPDSWRLRFHTQTAGCSLTAQQPENNIVRTAVEALAGVLGGTQSLHTNSMDEALALPTEHAVKIALRTQQILAHECGLTDAIDPLAGSYFIEAMTNRMEEEAEKIFSTIEGMGGMIPAIERGYPQREIARAAYEFQKAVEEKRYINVGINDYVDPDPKVIPLLKVDARVERDQLAELKKLRKRRDNGAVKRALEEVGKAARGTANLMPPILAAVKVDVTLGEIVDELKKP